MTLEQKYQRCIRKFIKAKASDSGLLQAWRVVLEQTRIAFVNERKEKRKAA